MQSVWQRKVNSATKICLLLLFTLTACSTTTEPLHPDLQTARHNFNQLTSEHGLAERINKYQQIQKTFAVFADVEYIIKSELVLADLYYVNQQVEQAEHALEQCKRLASTTIYNHYLADCYLIEFRYTQNSELFQQLDLSKLNQRQLGYWHFYQNDWQNLAKQLNAIAKLYPADAAYLYYQLGYAQADVSALASALELAQQHKLVQLITDSLFMLSKLYHQQNEHDLSVWYFSLALISAKAHAPQLVEPMQQWFTANHQANL